MKWILSLTLVVFSVVLLSCENSEQDALAKAQKCLDEVPQSNPESASSCLQYIEGQDSQQANILKCSIHMTAGGLTETKMVDGYEVLKDDAIVNKEAVYMTVLALDRPDFATGYNSAVAADRYCQASGVPGLKFISGIIVAGTYLARTTDSIGGLVPPNPTPADIAAAVPTMMQNCADAMANPGAIPAHDAACFPAGGPEVLGTTVTTLANSYCASAESDDDVCITINSAVAAAGGDPGDVGRALMCYLQNVGYDPGTDQCQ